MSEWQYQGKQLGEADVPVKAIGFVYLITNELDGREYVGKKLLHFKKTRVKTVKLKSGEKRKRKLHESVDSDWRTYYGSSPELSLDIEALGAEHFKREVLYWCYSKAECSYLEAREQFNRKVLESDHYYNGNIMVRLHKSHIRGKVAQ